ncbi:limbic system-associated membrane protein-like [Anticarsia gemmatalis]|uniref:limbic system-associated membrane protein-like n=1 Tax=Anticarsia gemmatalis TaxID=129554 RepID=UPI003F75C1C5
MRWLVTAVLFVGILCTVRSEGEPEPTLHIMARSNVYEVNDTKAIFCKGQNIVEPIQWYSPTGKLIEERSARNKRIFVERKNETDGVLVPLIIHQIMISDGGNWTCKSGNLSETREFIVGEKVKLYDRNVSMEGEEGKSVKLSCEAKGIPTPVVVWYKEKQQIKDKEEPKKYSIKADHTLEIKKLNHADVGLYTCKVRQKALSHYTDKTVQLTVQHKPIITTQIIDPSQKYKTEEVYAILNDTKNITCSAIANPPPMYRWFRRRENFYDEPITDPDTAVHSEDGTSSVLVLRLYNESYFGEYKCTVNNTRGAESVIFHVSPGSRPDPPDSVSLYSANVTELTFNVSCSTCTFPKQDEISSDPKTILGYSFQLVSLQEGYEADWSAAMMFEVDHVYNQTTYTVGPLYNDTKYHAQVRTRNAAGYSDWVDIPGEIATTAHAIKLTATIFVILAAISFVHLY